MCVYAVQDLTQLALSHAHYRHSMLLNIINVGDGRVKLLLYNLEVIL